MTAMTRPHSFPTLREETENSHAEKEEEKEMTQKIWQEH